MTFLLEKSPFERKHLESSCNEGIRSSISLSIFASSSNNYVNLFPTLKKSVPWSIDLDEYFEINSYITKFADETTDYLINLNLSV